MLKIKVFISSDLIFNLLLIHIQTNNLSDYWINVLGSHPRATRKKLINLKLKNKKLMTRAQGGRRPIKTDIFIDLIKVKSAISSQESPPYCCSLCLYLKKDLGLQVLLFRVAHWAVVPAGRCCHLCGETETFWLNGVWVIIEGQDSLAATHWWWARQYFSSYWVLSSRKLTGSSSRENISG